MIRLLTAVFLFASFDVVAQTPGSLSYAPTPVAPPVMPIEPVPIPSLFLLPLGIVMTLLGYRALRGAGGRQVLGTSLVVVGVIAGGLGTFHVGEVIAASIRIELSNPVGGTVDIPAGDAIYTNTSGVPMTIGNVVSPPLCATSAPENECESGLVLADSENCSTEYECGQTILFTSTAPADARAGGDTYTVVATATSGLPVAFSTTSTACTVTGSRVSFDAVGDCVIAANQAGDADFNPAPQVEQTFGVTAFAIGDSFQGGVIAELDGVLPRLIAAATDDANFEWGASGVTTGAASNSDGALNTNTVVVRIGTGPYAASRCDSKVVDGWVDWYLPARDELQQLYLVRDDVGGFASSFYWSSTEFDASTAWGTYLDSGQDSVINKNFLSRVRCTRQATR